MTNTQLQMSNTRLLSLIVLTSFIAVSVVLLQGNLNHDDQKVNGETSVFNPIKPASSVFQIHRPLTETQLQPYQTRHSLVLSI